MAPFHDGNAVLALAARFGRRAASAVRSNAVHAFGDDPRGGGFARAADARHDKGLRDAVRLKRVFQRAHHGVLPDQIGKGFRPVFAGEHAVLAGWSVMIPRGGFSQSGKLCLTPGGVHRSQSHQSTMPVAADAMLRTLASVVIYSGDCGFA